MTEIVLETSIKAPIQVVFDGARSIDVRLAANARLAEEVIDGPKSGLLQLGDEITWRSKHFGVCYHFNSKITKMKAPVYYRDEMLSSAFHSLKHDCLFEANGDLTVMKNVLRYKPTYGILGKIVNRFFLQQYLSKYLAAKNQIIKIVCENDD